MHCVEMGVRSAEPISPKFNISMRAISAEATIFSRQQQSRPHLSGYKSPPTTRFHIVGLSRILCLGRNISLPLFHLVLTAGKITTLLARPFHIHDPGLLLKAPDLDKRRLRLHAFLDSSMTLNLISANETAKFPVSTA